MKVGLKRLESLDAGDENGMILRSLVLSQYQRVMDVQTDTPTITSGALATKMLCTSDTESIVE